MANKNLFNTNAPSCDITTNDAGGKAYKMNDKHALAQLVCTGTFNNTFYASDKTQLDRVLELTKNVPTKFIAQTALYARTHAYMKDSPALLCAVLASRDQELLKKIFNKVIDNAKMLRNFVQIVRSGVTGRKSFGSSIKKLVQKWINNRTDDQLFRDSIGNNPSLKDVIKMVHPRPKNKKQEFMFGYITGLIDIKIDIRRKLVNATKIIKDENGKTVEYKYSKNSIPKLVLDYELYKTKKLNSIDTDKIPDVPMQMISSLNIGNKEWSKLAENGRWMFTRMNLNNFKKYGVLDDYNMVDLISKRLSDPKEVKNSKTFPYQLLTAYKNVNDVPSQIKNALQDALEISVDNVPSLNNKKVYVLVDTSGSMQQPVTGYSAKSSSTTCVEVAGLLASVILRKNENSEVIPFDTKVKHDVELNPRDSIMTNAKKLSRSGGGTNCACAIEYLNEINAKGDLIILISDNESWKDNKYEFMYKSSTSTKEEFETFRKRNPGAKLINIDIVPNNTCQVNETSYTLNIGGFSDSVFEIINAFSEDKLEKGFFTKEIEKMKI